MERASEHKNGEQKGGGLPCLVRIVAAAVAALPPGRRWLPIAGGVPRWSFGAGGLRRSAWSAAWLRLLGGLWLWCRCWCWLLLWLLWLALCKLPCEAFTLCLVGLYALVKLCKPFFYSIYA